MATQVLVLDDDAEFRAFLVSLMSPEGYRVHEAGRIVEARKIVREHPIELAIIDGLLPDGTGMDFIGELRARGLQLKTIFMSAFWRDMKTYKILTEQLHVTRVINKPFLAREFLVHLEAVQAQPAPGSPGGAEARALSPQLEEQGFEAQLSKLREAYGEKLQEKIQEIDEACSAARASGSEPAPLQRACDLAHKLRGSAGAYGFSEVSTAAGTIEDVLRDAIHGRLDPGGPAWRQVSGALRQLREADRRRKAVLLLSPPGGPVESYRKFELRVLVTDPDPACVAEMDSLARRSLAEIVHARDEEEALARAAESGFDGAILTLGQDPDDLCYRIARALRSVEGQASVPLAFLSEDDTVPSRVAAAYAGASLFLTKPLVPEAFVAALRRFTSLKRAEDPRVLVVDDDPSFTQHIALILAREGMKVTELADPLRTLEALHEVHPDLVLLDVVMPTLSGFDVCKMIRSAPEWEELPVLFLTVKLSAADRLACFEAGGDDYLSKPILTAELLARIRVRLDRVRLHRDRVNKDALTGLLARQAFAEAVEKRLAENRRIVKPLALCLLDLDHFKQINDTHGHLAGDRVLKGLGKLLDSRFRTEDVRGRWGGEEFVVAFNGEGAEAARDMLGRVLGELRQMGFENDRGDSFSASFSAGISLFPDDGYSLEDLIRAADRRMYRAKENGRSRIEI